jgi:hypothetical protein
MRSLKFWTVLIALLASSLAMAAENVVGKLGQTIEPVSIRVKMDDNARVLYTAKAFEYLVIRDTDYRKWFKVVMSDGSAGYVHSESIAPLPYNVTYKTPAGGGTPGVDGQAKTAMLEYSFNYIGTPYKWGGNSLTKGIDCSAFVQQMFQRLGVNLPRTAAEQASVGEKVGRFEELQRGDRLYFWSKKRNKIGHTGIFLGFFKDGGAYFIHSSTNNNGIAVDDLRVKKWRDMLVDVRRDNVKF